MERNFLNIKETRAKINLLREKLYRTKDIKDRLILIEKIKKIQNNCNHEILINLQDNYSLSDVYYCYCLKCHKLIEDKTNKNIINMENLKQDIYLSNNELILIAITMLYNLKNENLNLDYKEMTYLINKKITNTKNAKKLIKELKNI